MREWVYSVLTSHVPQSSFQQWIFRRHFRVINKYEPFVDLCARWSERFRDATTDTQLHPYFAIEQMNINVYLIKSDHLLSSLSITSTLDSHPDKVT